VASPARVYEDPGLPRSSLVVGWNDDAADLGGSVTSRLVDRLQGREFADIDPQGFFSLSGVSVERDIARFPDSTFYVSRQQELVVLKSDSPHNEWYRFLTCVLDIAEHQCKVAMLYLLGAMISLSAHTTPRQLFAVFSSHEARDDFNPQGIVADMDYQTPPGERPTLNSYLLWAAKERGIPGVSLWVTIPFYLAGARDAQAQKKVLTLLDEKLRLGLGFEDLDGEIRRQNHQLAEARSRFPDVDEYIGRLESNLILTNEERGELLKKVEHCLREGA